MKKIKKIIKKIFLISLVSLEIVLMNIHPTQAELDSLLGGILGSDGDSTINANGMLEQLEERYHLNSDSITNFGESFNVSDQKSPAPEVDIFFNPTNPKFGEEVTATAIPKYFQEGKENMYFTWYIKHKGCDRELPQSDPNFELCDSDGDGQVQANDWKVEAMRAVANSGFVKEKADYGSSTDDDSFNAHIGGKVNIQETDYCYLHDFISGKDYEIATASSSDNGSSDTFSCEGTLMCSSPYNLSCGIMSGAIHVPEQDMGSGDSTATDDGSGGSSSSTSVSITVPEHDELFDGTSTASIDANTDSGYEPICDPETKKTTCPEGTTVRCIAADQMYLINPDCNLIVTGAISVFDLGDPGEKDVNCETTSYENSKVEQKCEHQFAVAPGMSTGDGDFGPDEENFWGTDPLDPSTANNGNTDEANVAGIGTDKVTWTYAPGDQIGVIVEGQSYMGTKHDDSSNAITFALVNNVFNKEGSECKIEEKNDYTEAIKGYDVKIPFAMVNIDNCLEFNFVSPADGYQADNMDVAMDYYPKNPTVGSLGVDGAGVEMGGDNLVVAVDTSNKNLDNNQIYYKWSIYGFNGNREDLRLAKEDWTILSDDANFRKKNNINTLEGLGMDQFEMQLNDIGDYDFLRFFVESEEFFDTGTGTTGTTRSGRGDILVEPNKSSTTGIAIKSGDTDICQTGGSCEVLKNQIITVTLPSGSVNNYLWTLDGKEITTLGADETKQGNSVSFVLEGNPGDSHVISVIANDTVSPASTVAGNKGEKLTVTRNFVVVEPMIGLGPNNRLNRGEECKDLNGDTDTSSSLGTYTSISSNETVSNCREKVFSGSGTVTINPTYYPNWISGSLKNVKYYVNGVAQDSGMIDLSSYPAGTLVNVSYEGEYWQSDSERATLKNWGLSEVVTSGEKISDSITIKVTDSADQSASKKATKILAGLAYNIPEQMIFMFRIMLTTFIIIFAAGVVISFGEKKYN
ncbi:MAG: hypothetical protein WC682_02140 [Parcubacteria group bacterium]|jgi:hypothetical protein